MSMDVYSAAASVGIDCPDLQPQMSEERILRLERIANGNRELPSFRRQKIVAAAVGSLIGVGLLGAGIAAAVRQTPAAPPAVYCHSVDVVDPPPNTQNPGNEYMKRVLGASQSEIPRLHTVCSTVPPTTQR